MSEGTLYDAVWDRHRVRRLPSGQDQLFVGLHLIHEVTSPQAFGMLEERGLEVAYPERTHATADHIVPTDDRERPYDDDAAEAMMQQLEENVEDAGLTFDHPDTGRQGIVHVVGPEQGLTQPGMTVVCGDSHTATHGAFGALAFGIGTSQIRDVLATGTVAMEKQAVRRIEVTGELGPGVTAKDLILTIIGELGTDGGVGYVYEYGGEAVEALSMAGRMTVCNMSIEGGARAGYVEPDETTYDWLRETDAFEDDEERSSSSSEGRSPSGNRAKPGDSRTQSGDDPEKFAELKEYWESIRSGGDATYDDVVTIDGSAIEPTVTWGTTPGQTVGVSEPVPAPDDLPSEDRAVAERAQEHMGVDPGEPMAGFPVDVAFLGSCTNARLSDLRAAAEVVEGRELHDDVRGLVVPGSQRVKAAAEAEGLDETFREAGFEWRGAGCSMCLGMNDDQLSGDEVCASSSNRNFVGRQGSADGRTILMSPEMVAAAAVTGEVTDVRELPATPEVAR